MSLENEIVRLLAENKETGFRKLFDCYYKQLCSFGTKFNIELAIVEDIVQDVYINLWEREEYNSLTNLKSYLFISVKNRCFNYLKKNKSKNIENFSFEDNIWNMIEEEEFYNEKINRAINAFNQLPPKCKEVFQAVVIKDMKYKEAANELDISVHTIKSQLARALNLMRKYTGTIALFLILLKKNHKRSLQIKI